MKTCLQHFLNLKDRMGQASVLGLIATIHYKKKEFSEAIDTYKKALNIYKELNQKHEEIVCLKGIGSSLINLNKLDEASPLYFDCCEISSQINDIYSFLDCLERLIYIFEQKKEWNIVFDLYEKTLKAFQELKEERGIVVSYFNLGIIKKKFGEYNKALEFFKKGANIAIKSNFSELILKALIYIGETYAYLGNISKASEEYLKALKLADQIQAKNAITQIRVILKSFGFNDGEINDSLEDL